MKKRILSALLVLVMVVTMIPAFAIAGTAASGRDQTWYAENEATKKYTIQDAGDLLGFSDLLASGTTFEGWTLTLGTDITLNEGWAASATAPTDKWANIDGDTFKGIFDGNGKTISGVYMAATAWNSGIFGRGSNATVKNLAIVNSYITSTQPQFGAIFGIAKDTCYLQNIYCDVYVKSLHTVENTMVKTGGILGTAGTGTTTIENCVFAGTVDGTNTTVDGNDDGTTASSLRHFGGIVGYMQPDENMTASLNMSNTAFYGTILAKADIIGGLLGRADMHEKVGVKTGKVTFNATDCIVAGALLHSGNNLFTGSFFGQVGWNHAKENITIALNNCYYTKIDLADTVKSQPLPTYTGSTPAPADYCTAKDYKEISDMDDFSVVGKLNGFADVEDGYAKPTSMTEMTSGICDRMNHWYIENRTTKTMTINTKGELLGFSDLLAGGKNLAGWTITLAADIDLNEDWVASETAPKDAWGNTANIYFNGTFDGQGHTVLGVYLKTSAWNVGMFGRSAGGTVKNLVIKNSYIRGASNVGSVFGITAATNCTIENVYSEAYVTCSETGSDTHFIGGLVGCAGDNHTLNIKNSVFAGTLAVSDSTRIYGGIVGAINATATVNVSESAFYGKITNNVDVVAGIAARINGGKLNITNCIAAGSIQNQKAYGGAFYGQTTETPTITITDSVYTVQAYGTYEGIVAPVATSTYEEVTDEALNTATATVPAGFTAMPEGYPMPITLANTVWAQDETATTVFKGIQKNTENNSDIRLVGLVNVEGTPSDTIKSVGYDITIIRENGKTWTKNEKIYNLYTSVLEEGNSVPTTAEALKADYIYVATLGNIQEEVTIVVKTFHETTEGAVGYDDILVFTYNPAA